jgi:hypothetical protein
MVGFKISPPTPPGQDEDDDRDTWRCPGEHEITVCYPPAPSCKTCGKTMKRVLETEADRTRPA